MNGESKAVATQQPQQPLPLSDWDILRHQANVLVQSSFLPTHINTWQKATAIIMYGKEIGMGPMEAIQSIDVIQGKPTQKPQSMKAMVHKKLPGAIFRIIKTDETECVVEAARPGDPISVFKFTAEDAKRAGNFSKDNYKKYPREMLQWRCIGAASRAVFPDCLSGIAYTAEELGADVNAEGEVIYEQTKEKKIEKSDKEEPPPISVGETQVYTGTPSQIKELTEYCKKNGIKEKETLRDISNAMLNRPMSELPGVCEIF